MVRSRRIRLLDAGTIICVGILVQFCFDRNTEKPPTSDLCDFLEEIVEGDQARHYKAKRTDSDGSINLQHTIRQRYKRCPGRGGAQTLK